MKKSFLSIVLVVLIILIGILCFLLFKDNTGNENIDTQLTEQNSNEVQEKQNDFYGKYSAKRIFEYEDNTEECLVELEIYNDNTFKLVLKESIVSEFSYLGYKGNVIINDSKNITLEILEVYSNKSQFMELSSKSDLKLVMQENGILKNIYSDIPALSVVYEFKKLDNNYEMSIINDI